MEKIFLENILLHCVAFAFTDQRALKWQYLNENTRANFFLREGQKWIMGFIVFAEISIVIVYDYLMVSLEFFKVLCFMFVTNKPEEIY